MARIHLPERLRDSSDSQAPTSESSSPPTTVSGAACSGHETMPPPVDEQGLVAAAQELLAPKAPLSDCTLVASGAPFPLHKILLTQHCAVLG